MDEYLETNRKLWDKLTPYHAASEFYDVESFKAGRCTLQDIDIKELGDVLGKSLLHLQCHFGMDALSWARLGAEVTGVDFSGEAITLARSLSAELDIPAEFVCCNLFDLPKHHERQYDIVFTSDGVLAWLQDLWAWARVIEHHLKPGGIFYLRDFHPFVTVFDDEVEPDSPPALRYPYFHSDKPNCFSYEGSYAVSDAGGTNVNYEWFHSLGDIINSLIDAGLSIEHLREYPFSTYQSHPFLVNGDDGMWRYPAKPESLPLMFSIKAVK